MSHQLRNINFYIMLLADVFLFGLSLLLAYLFRFDFQPQLKYWLQLRNILPLVLGLKLIIFYIWGMYRGMWRYTDIFDFWRLFQAAFISSILIVVIILYLFRFVGFPRSIFFIDGIMTVVLCGGLRLCIRTLYRYRDDLHVSFFLPWKQINKKTLKKTNVLIIGAGDAGEKILREVIENPALAYNVVGFLDDDAKKWGRSLHGVRILGSIEELGDLIGKNNIELVFIAIPAASGNQMRRIVDVCKKTGVAFKTLPGIGEIMEGKVGIKDLREVSFEDLLGREVIELDSQSIQSYLRGRKVLVSGAGGSIGAELCRQIVRFQPAKLILLDASEINLFNIQTELEQDLDCKSYHTVLGHIQNQELMHQLFYRHKPEVVFHAAAYKHVPMLEKNPWEAVLNNIQGSLVLMQTALELGVDRFVVVSTDKAVRPTNVMGACKRVVELIMHGLNESQKTKFMAVRFGNVVGSSGSVVPVFQRQIEKGGPLTVTHPEMSRYFMTIAEASQLILQAGGLGRGGEIFILDMGVPVRISDMALDLIKLMGKDPADIEIMYTGLRPGEKMYEELTTQEEDLIQTSHEKIFQVQENKESNTGHTDLDLSQFYADLQELFMLASKQDALGIKDKLRKMVPGYAPREEN